MGILELSMVVLVFFMCEYVYMYVYIYVAEEQ